MEHRSRTINKTDVENISATENANSRRNWRSMTPEDHLRTQIRRHSYNTFQITTRKTYSANNSLDQCRLSVSSLDKSKTEVNEYIFKLPIFLQNEEPLGHSTLYEDIDFDEEISPVRNLSNTVRSLSENSIFLPDDAKSSQTNSSNDLNTAFIKNDSVR